MLAQLLDLSLYQFNPHALPLLAVALFVGLLAIAVARLDQRRRARTLFLSLPATLSWWLFTFAGLFLPAFGVPFYPLGYLPIFASLCVAAWVIARYGLVAIIPVVPDRKILAALEEGTIIGVTGIAMDISQRHRVEQALSKSEEQLLHDALHDGLTGLPNRALFLDRLAHTVRRAERQAHPFFAVLYVDFDQFKLVNDSLGHAAGDDFLREIARRLESHLRPGDTVARLGGDEFVLLLDGMENASDAIMVARRFQEALALPYTLGGNEVFISASIGIALSSTGYQQPEDLLRDADIAMHRAKSSGRGQYAVFDMTMHVAAVARLRLETHLRHAIRRGELLLCYQPIVSISSGRTVGFEALVRWQHPTLGMIGPERFIPIAEETGLIEPIGEWVLRTACLQARQWQLRFPEAPPWTMSVNLSARQFAQAELVEQVRAVLRETVYDPHSLKLEITESILMQNAEAASLVLAQMRALGIQLHIDDFGTGYSSLSYLHQFPLDSLKIDRSFVHRMGPGGDGAPVIQTIVALARNLGMKVVAEGVETAEQLSQLRHLGCHYGQGFLFAPPREASEAEAFLRGADTLSETDGAPSHHE